MSKTYRTVLAGLGLLLGQQALGWAALDNGKQLTSVEERTCGAAQQRREALRAALRTQRVAADTESNASANRQLTPAERAELRRQLGQQRRAAKSDPL